MTIEEMKQKKQEYGYSYEQIAELSNVPLATVQKIFGGVTKSPRHDTIRALEQVFLSREYHYAFRPNEADMIREEAPCYLGKPQGSYTIEDYYNLPDDCRAELIDGRFYDMAAPLNIHQYISGEVHAQLKSFVKANKGSCTPFYSPAGVQLDCDDKTMVEPDVFVVCDRSKIKKRNIYGAPDLVIETLSPSTREKDMFLKLYKYQHAGVREYWLIDPKKQTVLVYDFENDVQPVIYGFTDEIPVAIWDGACKISLKDALEDVAFLFEME